MRLTILALVLFLVPLSSSLKKAYCESLPEYALVITIDGLRPDVISKEISPTLANLIQEGAYTPTAKTVDPPKTLPSHTSLVTGLTPNRHGTYKNEWDPHMGYVEFDTIFTNAKNEGFSTAMFVGKDKLNFIAAPKSIDKLEVFDYSPSSVMEISESFILYMKESNPKMTLIHFPEPDIPGHIDGWMSTEYLESVKRVDNELGKIIVALKKAGVYKKTIIIITADHGGKGQTHRGNHPDVTTIPWLAVGKNIKSGYKIQEQVHIYDTAPTLLNALGLKPLKDIDGVIIREIFIQ